MSEQKNIIILGSTGSIGVNTLKVIRGLGRNYRVVGLAARKNTDVLVRQICEFRPAIVALSDEARRGEFERKLSRCRVKMPRVLYGNDSLVDIAKVRGANFVVCAMVGAAGLLPTLAAIESGKDIALANKEVLVIAGSIIKRTAKKRGVNILPLDSEHSAIFQCLASADRKTVSRIILTASGGPFYNYSAEKMKNVSSKEALKHPTWRMGAKISVDSANLMNKGLETIEAHHLFNIGMEKIHILIHPQSVVHSMVEFIDGSVLAQMSSADMRIPIQYALTYPNRVVSGIKKLDLAEYGGLTFEKPDFEKFPCLKLAIRAGKRGGTLPAVLNAANEIAVRSFMAGRIGFSDIPVIIDSVMSGHSFLKNPALHDILETDRWARDKAEALC